MERKIGEIFEHNNEWHQCVEQPDYIGDVCKVCSFSGIGNCELDRCSGTYRSDKKSVIFKKLEKIGGPYDDCGTILQRFKIYTNVTNADTKGLELHIYSDDTIGIEIKENKEDMKKKNDNRYDGKMDDECILLCDALNSLPGVETTSSCCGHCKNDFMIFFNCNNSYSLAVIARAFNKRYSGTYLEWKIEVETLDNGRYCYFMHSVKPYHTELEMKTDVGQLIENLEFWKAEEYKEYFNYEGEEEQPGTGVSQEIRKKPFCLKDAKSGKSVCTRDGRKARIICFDRKLFYRKVSYPILALVERSDGEDDVCGYNEKGKVLIEDGAEYKDDLMMLPEKKEGWINVYNSLGVITFSHNPYDTKEEALEELKSTSGRAYCVDTIKMEWEM